MRTELASVHLSNSLVIRGGSSLVMNAADRMSLIVLSLTVRFAAANRGQWNLPLHRTTIA